MIVHWRLIRCLSALEAQLKPTRVEGSELLLTPGEICRMEIWPRRASQSGWLHTMMIQFLSVAENSELRLSCSCGTRSLSLPSTLHLKSKAGTEQLGRGKRWHCLPSRWRYSIPCAHPYAHTLPWSEHNGKPVWSSKEPLGCPYKPRPLWLSLSCTDQPCKVLL